MSRRVKFANTLGIAAIVLAGAACRGSAPATSPQGAPQPGRPLALASDPGALAALPAPARAAFAVPEAPLGLTASDGTGLRLAKMTAAAVVDGPLAFTELRLAFENPEDRVLEGTFRIALPQGASIGRFAMKIGETWQEGEVVPRDTARMAYEDFLHRKQDPALMEKSAGNEFSARVFPIPARGVKEIVVAYVHEIPDGTYTLPLAGLPEVAALDADVNVLGATKRVPPLSLRGKRPEADLVVDARALAPAAFASAPVSGIRSGELAILRVRPQSERRPEPLASVLVLVDTSASRALGFEEEARLVEKLVAKVASEKGHVTVAAFDQSVAPLYEGPATGFGAKELARLRERGALGASNVQRALGWAKEQAKKTGDKRVVLVSDGVATAGASDAGKLGALAAKLKEVGVERIDALALGGIRDDAALARLVRGNVAHDGVVADAKDAVRALARLGEATRSNVPVKVEGATWSWPTTLDGVQAGDAYTIYAEVPADAPVKVSVDRAAAQRVEVRATERPLVERAVAQGKVNGLLERASLPAPPKDLARTITQIAVRNRIVTPYTSMLVLETDADYARFAIDRRALTDVLAVQDGAVKRVHRTFQAVASAPRLEAPPEDLATSPPGDPMSGPQPDAAIARRRPTAPAATAAPRVALHPAAPAAAAGKAPEAKPVARAPMARAPAPSGLGDALVASSVRSAYDDDHTSRGSGGIAAPSRARPATEAPDRDGDGILDADDREEEGPRSSAPPYEGRFLDVMTAVASKRIDDALGLARKWHAEEPGDVLGLVALGEAAEASGQIELASRAYGSVVDLFPNRADLRRMAGERLDRIAAKDATSLDLAVDTYTRAVADRPDHPAGHRLLAFALLRKGEPAKAFEVLAKAMRRGFDADRFEGSERILAEDLGLLGAAWAQREPARRAEITERVRSLGGRVEDAPSLRFVLAWETDANDVDFHIRDARGGHAFFSRPHLASGGDLYADVTTGYGPECFTIRSPKARRAGPYKLEAHYYSRGPMGYGMGKLQVVEHDGKGGLVFQDRPFVVMVDHAFVDLGTVP